LQQLQGAIALADTRINLSQPTKDASRDHGLFRGREEFGSFPAKWRPDRPIEWCRICRAEETRHGQSPHRASNAREAALTLLKMNTSDLCVALPLPSTKRSLTGDTWNCPLLAGNFTGPPPGAAGSASRDLPHS
jgi:hypothetical protein